MHLRAPPSRQGTHGDNNGRTPAVLANDGGVLVIFVKKNASAIQATTQARQPMHFIPIPQNAAPARMLSAPVGTPSTARLRAGKANSRLKNAAASPQTVVTLMALFRNGVVVAVDPAHTIYAGKTTDALLHTRSA
jgi:tetrahydromethanopterin S-methyltransferase subunit D